MTEKFCRVCGYVEDEANAPWLDEDGQLFPSHEICACCGCQHGYDDDYKSSVISYRLGWLKKGAIFHIPKHKPEVWNINVAQEQLKNIPKAWF